ncbi:hypothetical protein DDE82_006678 [Stemphylium lycopersici]|nr:hypothetical protein DDE82_006678 [Stemphylium lycopersici]
MHHHLLPTALTLILLAAIAFAACPRSTLEAITAQYYAAQTNGNTDFPSLSLTVQYTENRQPANITTGILSQPLKIDHFRAQHDTTACAAFSEIIVTDESAPYVIATQLRVSASNSTNSSSSSSSGGDGGGNSTAALVSEIDTIYTKPGDWLFNATSTLHWASLETWSALPPSLRSSRAVVKSAADAYCDLFSNASVVVPWGTPCARLEGGAYTGKGESSHSSFSTASAFGIFFHMTEALPSYPKMADLSA